MDVKKCTTYYDCGKYPMDPTDTERALVKAAGLPPTHAHCAAIVVATEQLVDPNVSHNEDSRLGYVENLRRACRGCPFLDEEVLRRLGGLRR